MNNHRPQSAPVEDVSLAEVLTHYWEDHAKGLPSSPTAQRVCREWIEYFGDQNLQEVAHGKAQDGFHQALLAQGLSESTMNRILTVGRAAINRAWKNGEISSVPHIRMLEVGAVEPRGRPMEFDEITAFIDAIESEHLFNFTILMLATASRPDAIRDLQHDQLDFENQLTLLNRKGRKQTKKYRPTIKMPNSVVEWLQNSQDGHLVEFRGDRSPVSKAHGGPLESGRAWMLR